MITYPFNFCKIRAKFRRRVNRFVIEAEVNGRLVKAYLPNPGRLWELLLPGSELLLSKTVTEGKLPFTVLACYKEDLPVLLHTHLTNSVVRHLLQSEQLEALKDYSIIRDEATSGRHRFDFLLQHKQTGSDYYLEVKSCTLFHGQVAMFPDAVTARGTSHLYRLRELAAEGIRTGCLFVVMNPQVEIFLPAYHVDYTFAEAFLGVKDRVDLYAVGIGFDKSFTAVECLKPMAIPVELLQRELQDGGAYLLLIRMEEHLELSVGALGKIVFKPGYYVYAGSALRALSKRIARHLLKKKQSRWHIDYLTVTATAVTAIPVISRNDQECELAAKIKAISGQPVLNFGSTDCDCSSHLFYFAVNPLQNRLFINLIQYYRMQRPFEIAT